MLARRILFALAVICCAGLLPRAAAAATTQAAPMPPPPEVAGRSYVLIDHATGRVLAERNADQRVEPASITKLMTAYVAFRALAEGRLKLDERISISERAWRSEGSRTFLNVGDQVPAEVLLQGMIVQSGNDAAVAIAERLAGSEATFAQLMTEQA